MSPSNTTIFISYRRRESRGHARSMFERLRHDFPGQVFMDVNDMKPGENFRTRIGAQLQGCRVLLALIGPEWQGATDKHGRVRLQDKRDWVRIEIATALQREITVIPVLIDGASMPDEEALPEDLHPLLDLHALSLDLDRHFEHGMVDLVAVMREVLVFATEPPAQSQEPRHSRESGNPEIEPTLPSVDPRLREDDGKGSDDGAEWWKRQIPWAKAYGEKGSDEFATPWVDIEIGGVVQRMRWIAPGSFLMGCDPGDRGAHDDEKPQHRVALTKGFWLADTACTQALWQAVTGQNPSGFKGSADLPVECVSWNDVTGLFLPKVTQRLGVMAELPTEAEWEYACHAGTQTPYWFGDAITPGQANFGGSGIGRTIPVKERPASGCGLYQMHGNVWEWCVDARRSYADRAETDPKGSQDGVDRAVRGGSWCDVARRASSAYRFNYLRGSRGDALGFRFVLRPIGFAR